MWKACVRAALHMERNTQEKCHLKRQTRHFMCMKGHSKCVCIAFCARHTPAYVCSFAVCRQKKSIISFCTIFAKYAYSECWPFLCSFIAVFLSVYDYPANSKCSWIEHGDKTVENGTLFHCPCSSNTTKNYVFKNKNGEENGMKNSH